MCSLRRSVKMFSTDDVSVYAAALSYRMFFSLFPFVIFLLALLGVLNLTSFFDWLLRHSHTVLPGRASGMVSNVVSQIRSQGASGALSLGAIVALTLVGVFGGSDGHARPQRRPRCRSRVVWKGFPLSILYTVFLAVLSIAAAAMMLIGPQLASGIAQQVGLGSVFAAV